MSFKTLLMLAFASVAMAIPFHHFEGGHHHAQPFAFGYTVKDKHGEQHRQESGDGAGGVKGSYGFTDDRGVHRQVNYVADKAGYRAEIKTNEHGTAAQDPAAVKMHSSAHPYFGGAGKGHGFAGFAGPAIAAPLVSGYGGLYGGAPSVVGVPAVGGFGAGYGGPLLGGAVKGYDSRFGPY